MTKSSPLDELEAARHAMNVASAYELLYYAPRTYVDYTNVLGSFEELAHFEPGQRVCALVKVESVRFLDKEGKPTTLQNKFNKPVRAHLSVSDNGFRAKGQKMDVVFFGNVWPLRDTYPGHEIFLTGKVGVLRGARTMGAPEIIPASWGGRVFAIYPAVKSKLSAQAVQAGITGALKTPGVLEQAAYGLLERLGLDEEAFMRIAKIPAIKLLRYMHQPETLKQGYYCMHAARQLTIDMILRNASKVSEKRVIADSMLYFKKEVTSRVIDRIQKTFKLTGDQKTSIKEVLADLASPYPMRRLLSGDVGTGKTITFLTPALVAFEHGFDVGVLAPNDLVARQIGTQVSELFPEIPVQVINAKTKALEARAFFVGTTAMLSRIEKAGRRLHLMIVDEQHKFSREQREALVNAGTNYLEATATAIPRTMALVSHAGMSVSQLRERPFVRNVKTSVLIGKAARHTLLASVKSIVEQDAQIAIVYPAVKKSEEMIDVEAAAEKWAAMFPDWVSCLHGKMQPEEKENAIAAFKRREKRILVTSTVIEVGVSLPALRGIIIVNSERYGLAQLHQLRGRVARLGGEGLCLLYCPQEINEETYERLALMEEIDDGFQLAERDLQQRGFGSLEQNGSNQTGKSVTLFANIEITPEDLETKTPSKAARPS